jgi:rhodanese-related sulfurtransferase
MNISSVYNIFFVTYIGCVVLVSEKAQIDCCLSGVCLRSEEEAELVGLSFTHNIPIAELPDRLAELPKDKTIVAFCASSIRAVMAFVYLQAAGFEDVKNLPDELKDLTVSFMPPLASKHYDILKK